MSKEFVCNIWTKRDWRPIDEGFSTRLLGYQDIKRL